MILSLSLLSLRPTIALADNYEEAQKQAAKAFYMQSGLDEMVKNYSRRLERQYLPEFVIQNGGILVFVAQSVVSEQIRISYKWEF
jgi:hypothetical protein